MQISAAETLAKGLMMEYLPRHSMFEAAENWAFRFSNSRKYLGHCNHRNRTISMSKQLCLQSSEDVVRDAILHEISHALKTGDRFSIWPQHYRLANTAKA